jgi:hypothetical protein
MSGREERYPIKDDTLDFLLSSDFIELCLKEGIETESLGKLIAHMSYKAEKFTKRFTKLLLNGISRNDYEKVKNYLDVVTQLVIVKDELQMKRLEWIFGFGYLVHQVQNNIKEN